MGNRTARRHAGYRIVSSARTLPALEPESAFYWTSGADGVLRVQRCGDCGHWQHPPLALCEACHGEHVAPQPVSGRGRVKAFTINVQPWMPGMKVPFVFAAIELDEQPRLYVTSNILAAPDAVASGMAVEVCFEQHEDVWLPMFRPAGEDVR